MCVSESLRLWILPVNSKLNLSEKDQKRALTKIKMASLATSLLATRVHTGPNHRFHKLFSHRRISQSFFLLFLLSTMDIFSSYASKKFVVFQNFGSREEKRLQRPGRVQTHTLQTDIIFLTHHPPTGRCEKPQTFNCYNLDTAVQTEDFSSNKAKHLKSSLASAIVKMAKLSTCWNKNNCVVF